MKEEVYEKFANKALQYIEGTEAFLKEQLPDYFQQVVTYHAIEAWVWVALSLITLIVSSLVIKKCVTTKDKYDSMPERYIPVTLLLGVISIVMLVCFCDNLSTALKATIAPKVFIVDYLRGKE